MPAPFVQLVPFTLRPGHDEASLIAASDAFQAGFAALQPGVRQRILMRSSDGRYADLVVFDSREAAEQVMQAEQSSPACGAFFDVLQVLEEPAPAAGIQAFDVIRAY